MMEIRSTDRRTEFTNPVRDADPEKRHSVVTHGSQKREVTFMVGIKRFLCAAGFTVIAILGSGGSVLAQDANSPSQCSSVECGAGWQ